MADRQINVSVVYCIVNIYNDKRYVGSTTKFSKRKSGHLYDLRHERHHSCLLQKDYNEYGEDAIKFIILEKVPTFSLDFLIEREQFWIDKYHPEYNINQLAGHRFPKKTKKEIEAIRKRMTGRKQSQEEKDKRASSIKKFWKTHPAKTIPKEMRKHLSEINTGKRNPNWGMKRSKKTRELMSQNIPKILYTFKSPEGKEYTFKNLSKAPIPVPYGALRNLYRKITKTHKGWTFVKAVKI